MIADDIKIMINFNRTIPDGVCIHKKGCVANYKKKKKKHLGEDRMMSLVTVITALRWGSYGSR